MRISVTREDIKNGVPKSDDCCAIALAVQRVVPSEWPYKIRVSSLNLSVVDEKAKTWKCISLPPDAREFIQKYDSLSSTYYRRINVLPFSFDIKGLPIPGLDDNGYNFATSIVPAIGFDSDGKVTDEFIDELMDSPDIPSIRDLQKAFKH
jgi:hypothetical protein